MIAEIDRAREAGDTMGGSFEVIAHGVPPGLGSYVQWDRKLDGRLAQALMSIPAIKAVGIGRGPRGRDASRLPRPRRDRAAPARRLTRVGVARPTNNAGGLEGGVTNGEDLRITGYMKPISTLMKPLRSVDLATMTESPAAIERSDVCAVPAAAVVGEAMVAFVLADAADREIRRRFDRRARRELAGVPRPHGRAIRAGDHGLTKNAEAAKIAEANSCHYLPLRARESRDFATETAELRSQCIRLLASSSRHAGLGPENETER